MPIREYQSCDDFNACDYCRAGYEQFEAMNDPPAQKCLRCGAPVRRLISAPNVGASASGLDDRARHVGFHKFKKLGRGEYERQY